MEMDLTSLEAQASTSSEHKYWARVSFKVIEAVFIKLLLTMAH